MQSTSPDEAADAFLHDLQRWAHDCIRRYADEPTTDVHDQGTYMVGWRPMVHALDDRETLAFMKRQRDLMHAGYVERDLWRHGYWRRQEVHHGTEHFELFLGVLHKLDPDDGDTIAAFVDAAEHLGNWSSDVPDWYDQEHDLFHSLYFGVDEVGRAANANSNEAAPDDGASQAVNVADHFRCITLLMMASAMTGQSRYADLATTYGRRWARGIVDCPTIPAGLTRSGVYDHLSDNQRDDYRSFAGMSGDLSLEVDRAENLLASDAPAALHKLWDLTGEEVFHQALIRLLDALSTQLDDPDAGPAADALRQYRKATGDNRYDAALVNASGASGRHAATVRSIELTPRKRTGPREVGVGKRNDLPRWTEDGRPRKINPITLAAGADVSGDDAQWTLAIDLAHAYFNAATQVFPDGRHHGCAAGTISAVARGHGRDNNAGMTTAVLDAWLTRN